VKLKSSVDYVVICKREIEDDSVHVLDGKAIEEWMEDGSIKEGDKIFEITKPMRVRAKLFVEDEDA